MYIDPKTLSNQSNQAPGLILLTEEQEAMYLQYSGFVTVTEELDEHGAVSYKVEPNTEAWEAWKASLPPDTETAPSQTLEERVDELDEALNMILTGVTE